MLFFREFPVGISACLGFLFFTLYDILSPKLAKRTPVLVSNSSDVFIARCKIGWKHCLTQLSEYEPYILVRCFLAFRLWVWNISGMTCLMWLFFFFFCNLAKFLNVKQYILVFCLLLQWDMISVDIQWH